jgi:hypothetical protein
MLGFDRPIEQPIRKNFQLIRAGSKLNLFVNRGGYLFASQQGTLEMPCVGRLGPDFTLSILYEVGRITPIGLAMGYAIYGTVYKRGVKFI